MVILVNLLKIGIHNLFSPTALAGISDQRAPTTIKIRRERERERRGTI